MLFSKRHLADEIPQVFLNSTAVLTKDSVKHLGVRLTQSLQWSAHGKMLMQQTSHKLYTLKRLAHRTAGSKEFVQHLYLTIARPTLEHACAVWANCPRSDMIALERIQLSFVRAILHLPPRTCPNRSVLSLVGWPTLAWRRRRYQLLLFWRLYHGEGPPSLQASLPASISDRCSYSF